MAPPLQLQVKRGVQANIQNTMPLALGEMYFGTDTGNLFFGTPGVGIGYIQIGDTTNVNQTLQSILMELRAMRLAIVQLACEGNKAKPTDFEPDNVANDTEFVTQDS